MSGGKRGTYPSPRLSSPFSSSPYPSSPSSPPCPSSPAPSSSLLLLPRCWRWRRWWMRWWMWLWWMRDVVVAAVWLPFSVCLGDAACHVIDVGTCCPNLPQLWCPGSSAVERAFLLIPRKPWFDSRWRTFFLHVILIRGDRFPRTSSD